MYPMPKYISQCQFAKVCGLTRSTVAWLVKAKKIKTVPYTIKRIGIDPSEVTKWKKEKHKKSAT